MGANYPLAACDGAVFSFFFKKNCRFEDKINSDHDSTSFERVLFSRRSIFTGEVRGVFTGLKVGLKVLFVGTAGTRMVPSKYRFCKMPLVEDAIER